MPRDWERASGWLQDYLDHLDEYERQPRGDFGRTGKRAEELYRWFHSHHSRIAAVVADLVPDAEWPTAGSELAWDSHQRNLILRAQGAIEHRQDLAEAWTPSSRIELEGEAFHEWVWAAAKGLWESDHWGEAVEAAIKVLNAKLQSITGMRESSGADLVRRAFSTKDPTETESRLRVTEDDGSETYRSVQIGAMHLGEAVFMYWRNALAHEPVALSREEALEALAATSAFARALDGSELLTT